MEFKKTPETFFVEEILQPQLWEGKYYYYILEQKGLGTDKALKILETENNTKIYSSGLKDAQATTKQCICSETQLKTTNSEMQLKFIGNSAKKIFFGMHTANKFKILFGKTNEIEEKFLKEKTGKIIYRNYFDEQRFSAKTIQLGEHLKNKEWEKATKSALTDYSEKESEESKRIKKTILKNWEKWENLSKEEIPEPKKKIFLFLAENADYHEAILLLDKKTVRQGIRAMQAFEFNRKLKEQILKQKSRVQKNITINSEEFPILFKLKGIKTKQFIEKIYPIGNALQRGTLFKT